MLTAQTIDIVKQTAPVVAEHAEAITRRFYSLMFAGNPEVLAYFNPAHQHAGTQQRALAGAICAYAANIDNLGALGYAVELIAQKHCSLGIQSEHYPIVGKHLLVAIKDVLGDDATDDIIAAWAEAYGVLAEIFVEREQQIYEAQRGLEGGWNGYRRFLVERKSVENEFISSFYLVPEDGGRLPSFQPGQYITVAIDRPGQVTAPRNYSLSDRPGTGYFRITVKREPGAGEAPAGVGSNHLHDRIKVGDAVQVGPPCGDFVLDVERAAGRPIVLLSGGIGITPLTSMLHSLMHAKTQQPVYFIHAARNSRYHALGDEVRQATAGTSNFRTHFCYDQPLSDDAAGNCCDSVGVIDLALLKRLLPGPDAEFYFCGPKPFMASLVRSLRDWGVPEEQMHYEFFGPKEELGRPQRA
jgi:nitric oxide dioxygenase